MKKIFRNTLCVLLSLVFAVSTAMPALGAVNYPSGVTNETAKESSDDTDKLVANAVKAMNNSSLKDLVLPMLYSDETLSSILTTVYSSLGESESVLSILGIDISVSNVANRLSAYKSVYSELSKHSSWSDVKLENAKWGVTGEQSFANAVAAILSPFNQLLNMLLNSGTYKHSIIRIPGDDGYEKGLISMLEALGCTEIKPADKFEAEADANQNSMIANITISLLSMLKRVLNAPSDSLTTILPDLAYYIKEGGLEDSVNALLRPLTIHIGDYIQLFTGSQMISFLMFIQDPGKYTLRFSENITVVLNDMIESSEYVLPEIDLEALEGCQGNEGDAYTLIFMWLIGFVKENKEKILSSVTEGEGIQIEGLEDLGADIDIDSILNTLLSKSTDDLFRFLVELFTKTDGKALEYQWESHSYTPATADYSGDMSLEDYTKVLNEIDGTLNEFVKESGEGYKTVGAMLKDKLYTNEVVTKVATTLYGFLGSDDLKSVAGFLNLPGTPAALASVLGSGFSSAKSTLYRYSKFDSIHYIYWGFHDGSKDGFVKALTAVLSPFVPLFDFLFANGSIEILGSINLGGSNGYNTVIIPILEALGCPAKSIKTYDKYEKGRGTTKVISDIINPIFDLVDRIAKKPVYRLTEILPNVLFFIDNGSLIQCLINLLYPIDNLLGELGMSFASLGFDLNELKEKDLLTTVGGMIPSLLEGSDPGIKLTEPDLKSIESFGTLTTINSKRTFNGSKVTAEYVKADQPAILQSLLRYVIGLLGDEENSEMLSGMMGGDSGEGEGDMFSMYSSGITEQFADMTTDEIIAWLYDLLFYERATVETTEEYIPEIHYEGTHKKKLNPAPFLAVGILMMIAAVFVILNHEKIKEVIEDLQAKRNARKSVKEEEKVKEGK